MESLPVEEASNNENELNASNVNVLMESNQEEPETEAQQDEEPKAKLTKLPIGRIKSIIKSDPEISLINQEAVLLVTKATELFIDSLTKESYKYTCQSKKKTVQKHDVQSAIDNVDALLFLDGI